MVLDNDESRSKYRTRKVNGTLIQRGFLNMAESILTNSDGEGEEIDSQKKYLQSDKGKKAVKRYKESEKGKQAISKTNKSVRHKLSAQKYRNTPKGKDAAEDRKLKLREFTKVQKWLKDHPGKTVEDYWKENPKGE